MGTLFFSPSPPNQTSTMAVNLGPDSSPIIPCSSPRISFSYILDHHPSSESSDHVARSDQNLSSNDFDLDFCLPSCEFDHETSPADELFFNGVILPTHIKQTDPNPPHPVGPSRETVKQEKCDAEEEKGIIVTSTKASLIREEKGRSKSFWRFMRSSSLNCDSSHHCRKSSFWSSIPLLARSYSTGSSSSLQSSTKNVQRKLRQSSKSSSSTSGSGLHQKPPLKKVQIGTNGNSSPAFNVPPPYITKGTSDLLGFGSLFRNGNDKKGKKT